MLHAHVTMVDLVFNRLIPDAHTAASIGTADLPLHSSPHSYRTVTPLPHRQLHTHPQNFRYIKEIVVSEENAEKLHG